MLQDCFGIFFDYKHTSLIIHITSWIIKVKHPKLDILRDGIWVPSSSFLVTLYLATSCTPYLHITGHWSSGQAWDLSDLTPYATTCMLDTREETIIHLVK